MFQKTLLTVVLLCVISACASPKIEQPAQVEVDKVNTRLAELEETLVTRFDEICRDKETGLRKQLADAKKRASSARREARTLRKQCDNKKETTSKKLLLGEVENIELLDQEVTLEARVDTGAETSSLGIFNLTKFERDGKDWVKFTLKPANGSTVYEYPVHDYVKIKQRDEAGTEARFEIKLDIKMGKKKYRKQLFNLANRRHLDYQVLIGRSFLRDIAVVDVSAKHQLKRK